LADIDEVIALAPPDDGWPARFEQEATRLRRLLGARADGIEHIGSTAVPGLWAKPIVDILIGVDEARTEEAARLIVSGGYEDLGEAGVSGRRYLRKRSPDAVNVHLVQPGGALWRNNLLLRDYLRANPAEAARYARHKQAIVARGVTMLLAYSVEKVPLIEELLARARAAGR
jgi:GrpB-like predicted nucleotidyltransferase (UPF0157 family)